MKRPHWVVLGVAYLGMLLGACQTQSLTPIHTAGSTVSSALATMAPTSTALLLPTRTPVASATPSPYMTPTPVPSATPVLPLAPIFGMGMEVISQAGALDAISQAGIFWVRSNRPVIWAEVEPVEGARNWDAMKPLEEELRNAAALGMEVIQVIRVTPAWAQKIPGTSCGAIKLEKLGAFALFMRDLVTRYSVAPYKVRYWEIWNEPDIDPSLVPPASDWGCWGDATDAYYGGEYYARLLKLVYPQIKSADPQSQVLVGGLVLDCDPVQPPQGKDCKPTKFIEGILRGNGGPYFDGVSFHAYDYYYGRLGVYQNSSWHSAWNSTGPSITAKSRFLKDLLSAYGANGKSLFNTEAALICWNAEAEPACQTSGFQMTKAYYVPQLYVAALAEDLEVSAWYSTFGWQGSGLINPTDRASLPAMDAYRFVAKELRQARFLREVKDYPGIRVYEFQRAGQRIWVLWSLDGASHVIRLPDFPLAGFDVFGNSIPADASQSVTLMPLYIEWRK